MAHLPRSISLTSSQGQILLDPVQAAATLCIDDADLSWLVSTRQLSPVTIRGKLRFLRSDLEAFAQLYRDIQSRYLHAKDDYAKKEGDPEDRAADCPSAQPAPTSMD